MGKGVIIPEKWERQPGETVKAFEAFKAYRDLGKDRSIRRALEVAGKKASNHRSWERWAAKYSWRDRVAAFVTHNDNLEIETAEEERKKMLKRHLQISLVGQNKIVEYLNGLPENAFQGLSPVEVFKIFGELVKVERVSRGEPDGRVSLTGKIEHEHKAKPDIQMLTIQELQAELDKRNIPLRLMASTAA